MADFTWILFGRSYKGYTLKILLIISNIYTINYFKFALLKKKKLTSKVFLLTIKPVKKAVRILNYSNKIIEKCLKQASFQLCSQNLKKRALI